MTTSPITRPRNHAEGLAFLATRRAEALAQADMQIEWAARLVADGAPTDAVDEVLTAARASLARATPVPR